jgi:hypothetical protein
VVNDHGPVRRDVNVQLDGIGTQAEGLLERPQGVLHEAPRGTPVPDSLYIPARAAHGARPQGE